jgi:VWFA-related protein
MIVPRLLAAALVCGALVCVVLLAQNTPTNPPTNSGNDADSTIRTKVHLVLVPVTVTDAKGKIVDGLKADDFVLYDDGQPQRQVQVDSSDTVLAPVALVIAIEGAAISQAALEKIHKVGGMLEPLISGEKGEAAVLSYDEEVHTLQAFTRDSDKIDMAFESIEGRTIKRAKMLDAVMEGVKLLTTAPESNRRMMIILGESRDRGSKTKLAAAVEAAERASVTMYPITYSAQTTAWTARPEDTPPLPEDPDYAGGIVEALRLTTRNDADEFAKWTGGRHLSFTRLEGLQQAIQRLSAEVHSQYLLSFVPQENNNKGLHRLIVQVRGHKGSQIRARPAYWP